MGFGKDGKGVIIYESVSKDLGTLADQAAKVVNGPLAITDDFRMLKSEVVAHHTLSQTDEGHGLYLGIADGDLTEAEIAAAITTGKPLDRNDSVLAAVAERFVKLFAASGEAVEPLGVVANYLNKYGGPMLEVNPKWTFGDTSSWKWFIFNNSGATLTTGLTVRVIAKSFGVWVH